MSKKSIQSSLFCCGLICILLMSCFFAYRILTFSTQEPMGYLLSRFICTLSMALIIIQNIKSKITIWLPTFTAALYAIIVSINILVITRTSINDLTDAILWPLLYIATYGFTAKGYINHTYLFRVLTITKIVCLFYSTILVLQHVAGLLPGTSEMFPTYVLLALVPFSLYEMDMKQRKKFNLFFLIYTFVIMLMTSKRSCILVLSIGTICYFMVKAKIQGRSMNAIINRMVKYLFIIIMIFIGMYLVTIYLNLDIIGRLSEMLDGDTNGRSAIWENVLIAFNNSSFIEKIFGHGYHAFRFYKYRGYMSILNGNLAHNDYLNTLYDYGIIGLIIYVCFLFSMIRELIRLIKCNSIFAPSFTFSIILMFFLTVVSYFGIESRIINYVAVYWGYSLAIKRFHIHIAAS